MNVTATATATRTVCTRRELLHINRVLDQLDADRLALDAGQRPGRAAVAEPLPFTSVVYELRTHPESLSGFHEPEGI